MLFHFVSILQMLQNYDEQVQHKRSIEFNTTFQVENFSVQLFAIQSAIMIFVLSAATQEMTQFYFYMFK